MTDQPSEDAMAAHGKLMGSYCPHVPTKWHAINCRLCVQLALDEFRAAGVEDYEEVLADKRRLVRELDAALHGEDGAAKQASLCDLIKPARDLRQERDELRAQVQRMKEDSARWQLLCAKALAGVRMYRDGNMELGGITFGGVLEAERAIDAACNQEGAEDA